MDLSELIAIVILKTIQKFNVNASAEEINEFCLYITKDEDVRAALINGFDSNYYSVEKV